MWFKTAQASEAVLFCYLYICVLVATLHHCIVCTPNCCLQHVCGTLNSAVVQLTVQLWTWRFPPHRGVARLGFKPADARGCCLKDNTEGNATSGWASDDRTANILQTASPVGDLLHGCLLSTEPPFSLASHLSAGMQNSLRTGSPRELGTSPVPKLDAAYHIQSLTVLEMLLEKVATAGSKWESGTHQDTIVSFTQV
jgi:hypothetical protein